MHNWSKYARPWIGRASMAICLASAICNSGCASWKNKPDLPPSRPVVLAAYDWQRIPTGVTNAVYVPATAGRWAHVLSDHAVEVLLGLPPATP